MILVRIHSSSVISWRFLVPSPGFSPISCLEFATAEVLWLRHHPESNLLRTGYRTKAGCLQIPTPKAINRSYNVIYNFKNQLCKHNFWVGTCRATTNSKVIPDDPSDLTPSIWTGGRGILEAQLCSELSSWKDPLIMLLLVLIWRNWGRQPQSSQSANQQYLVDSILMQHFGFLIHGAHLGGSLMS